jgi:hypothetical protein
MKIVRYSICLLIGVLSAGAHESFLKKDLYEIKALATDCSIITPALDLFLAEDCNDANSIAEALQDAALCLEAAQGKISDEQLVLYAEKLETYWTLIEEHRAPRPPFVDPSEGPLASDELTYFPRDVFIARNLQVGGTLTVEGNIRVDASSFVVTDTTPSAAFECLDFKKSRAGALVQNGDSIGCINCAGFDGSEFISGALIEANVDGTPSSNDMPGSISFLTTSDGTAVPVERMQITNAGVVALRNNLEIGNTTSATVGTISKNGIPFMRNPGLVNTFLGLGTGNLTLTGLTNLFVGASVAPVITSGNQNVLIGFQAGSSLITGASNTFVGALAGDSETIGNQNIAIGNNALGSAGHNRDIAIGSAAFSQGSSAFVRSDNVVIGFEAGRTLGNAPAGQTQQNVFIGRGVATNFFAGIYLNMTQVSQSVLVGAGASSNVPSGLVEFSGIGVGAFCGSSQTTSLGAFANASQGGSTALGVNANTIQINQIQLGRVAPFTPIASLRCQVALTVVSDERHKKDIEECPLGLAFIERIRPLSYDKDGVKELGFSAQGVAYAAEELGVDFPGVSYSPEEDLYWMRHNDLFAPIVKALQGLAQEMESLKMRRNALRAAKR